MQMLFLICIARSRSSDADAVISFELMYKSLKKKKETKKAGGCCEAFWINSQSGECKSEDFVLVFTLFFPRGCFSKVGRKYAPKKPKTSETRKFQSHRMIDSPGE